MKQKRGFYLHSERGQSMVLIALVMIGLIALMGLAIDGGNLFLQRRHAQNAADAAALAGTRLLAQAIYTCGADAAGTDTVIAREVNRYAERNGVPDTNDVPGDAINANVDARYVNKNSNVLGQVGGGIVPNGATGILVDVKSEHPTYFVTVVGIGKAGASAQAQAMTGVVTSFPAGGGLLPFAVQDDVVQNIGPDGEFIAKDIDNHNTGGEFCWQTDKDPEYDFCDGEPAPQSAQRGWLNLNFIYNTAHLTAADPFNRTFEQSVSNRGCGDYPNISTDDGLQGWATRGGCPYPYPVYTGAQGTTNGDFIHGSPGLTASALAAVKETYEGKTAYAPVFDFIYTSEYMEDHFPAAERPAGGDAGRWPRAGGGVHAFLYHIVGYVPIHIQNVDTQGSDHSLTGMFKSATIGEGVISPDDGFDSSACRPILVYGVSLWK